MSTNQDKGHANEAKGKDKQAAGNMTDDKHTEHKDKADKHGGKDGAVLGDINGEARNEK